MKSVRIQSYSGPYFPAYRLNTERYGVSFRIQSECEKNADPNNSKYGHLENRVHHNLFCKCRSSLRRFSFKKVFLKLSQNLGESTCSKVSFLKKKLKKRIWHRCFFVTFAKFLRTPFLKNASGQLLQQVAF